ncbi:MAG TPA: M20/M25/M40 family metallo-hydrolase [Candidatus Binatia bacterium]|nr:M20/M25/M40 family metallo-hydrolase [Candidatus Binatia bacterium]
MTTNIFMNRRVRIKIRLSLALIYLVVPNIGRSAEPVLEWATIEQEAASFLSRYIQIDTTNPPGNEIKAAEFLKSIFDREGIEAKIIESAPGRANLRAVLRGDGSRKAIILLNHMDVVPADEKLWKAKPFGGEIKDGVIWGRGALDDKGPGIMELAAMLTLKRQKIALKSDVIFLGTADEEAGGALGAGHLLMKYPELFDNVGLVLNEGGGIRVGEDGRARVYNVSMAEKTPLWLRLTATGTPGHGSSPGNDMAVHKLIAVLNRVMKYQSPIKVVPEVQKFYADTAQTVPESRRTGYRDLRRALEDSAFRSEFLADARERDNVSNTIAITRITGSDKVNVISGVATAEIDIRLLPGEDPKVVMDQVRGLIDDESIKIEVLLSFPAAVSQPHPEAMKVITEFAKSHDAGVPVVAPLVRGFTDCHFFREKGIPCLGFMPRRSPPSSEGLVHGVDERIQLESFNFGIRAMYEIVRKLATE